MITSRTIHVDIDGRKNVELLETYDTETGLATTKMISKGTPKTNQEKARIHYLAMYATGQNVPGWMVRQKASGIS